MTAPPQLDVVTVAIALAATVFGPAIAEVVGPYAVIFLGALLGAAWSASRRPPPTQTGLRANFGTLGYIALLVLLAVLVTVPCATLAASYLPGGLESRVLLAPVAAVIAGIGPDWPGVFKWGLQLIQTLIEQWARKPPGNPPGGPVQ